MSIQDIENILVSAGIEPNEAKVEVKMLIEHFCEYSAKDLIMGKKLDEKKLEIAREKAEYRARTGEPIQYIIENAYFLKHIYRVTKDVLIPRDETELVTVRAIEAVRENGYKKVLDIGTGSGCIACEIAFHSDAQVLGVDISSDALRIALENSENLNLQNKAIFRKSDIFSGVKDGETFDLIVSNPPYIPKGTVVQKEVTFEPKIALFTDDEQGIEFYQKIISSAKKYLNQNGQIMFELGIGQSELVKELFEKYGFKDINTEKDLAGIDRFISAKI